MTAEPASLFDPATTLPQACPVDGCHATRQPGTTARLPVCQHDLSIADGQAPRHRPGGCLNRIDPRYTDWPEGF